MAPSNLLLLLLLATATPLITGQLSDYPTANLSTLWTNNNASLKHSITYADGSVVRAIVLRSPKAAFYGPSFAQGSSAPPHPATMVLSCSPSSSSTPTAVPASPL
jgi:hypothetical protein